MKFALKQEKGVTLTSLCIYVLGLIVVIGLMSTFTSYFYKNTNDTVVKSNSGEEYTRFLAYFTKDVNSDTLKNVSTSTNSITFEFQNGKKHQYTFKNKKIYYVEPVDADVQKQIVLCTKVTSALPFRLDGKKIITNFLIGDEKYSNSFIAND